MHVLKPYRMVVPAFLVALLLSGCVSYRIDGVFAQPTLADYRRHAMYGLPPEREQILMSAYIRAFPGQGKTFIDGPNVFQDQGSAPARLDEATRSRIAELLNIEAIILAFHVQRTDKDLYLETLTMKIVDAKTGEIVGSVVVTARSRTEIRARSLSERAVAALKAQLEPPKERRRSHAPVKKQSFPRRDTQY